MKPATACLQCRQRKLKCRSRAPMTACLNYLSKQRPCSSVVTKPSQATRAHDAPRLDPVSLPVPLALQMVDDYIRCLHDRPHSLFHVPTLRRAVIAGTLGRALLLSICSLGCRFSTEQTVRDMRIELFAEASSYLTVLVENTTLENVQTCILLANISSAESKPSAEAMYFGS